MLSQCGRMSLFQTNMALAMPSSCLSLSLIIFCFFWASFSSEGRKRKQAVSQAARQTKSGATGREETRGLREWQVLRYLSSWPPPPSLRTPAGVSGPPLQTLQAGSYRKTPGDTMLVSVPHVSLHIHNEPKPRQETEEVMSTLKTGSR